MTSEEIDVQHKIDRIFSPYAMEQMEKYFAEQTEPTHVRFVHYTSAKAALEILKTKRIWMRNVTCMSDFSEVMHGYGILQKVFSEESNRQAFTEALDACAPGIAKEAFGIFDSWWNDVRFNTYITSISEHDPQNEDSHGRLSMWRAFGGDVGRNVARVAIVVKIPMTVVHAGVFNLVFSPVAYLDDKSVQKQFLRVVENIRRERCNEPL